MELSIVVAMDKKRVIGSQGKIPWHLPEDLKQFAKLTKGHPVIMGRKTYESIGFPLKERTNIILSSQEIKISGCIVVHSFEDAVIEAEKTGSDECFVIGGSQIYKLAFPFVTKMYITAVSKEYKGDSFFPDFDENQWKVVYAQFKLCDKADFTILQKQTKSNGLNFAHSREQEQKKIMAKAQQDGKCPFCWENIEKYHIKPIIKKGDWWWVSENGWPYKGTAKHLMFFYKKHTTTISDVTPEAFTELNNIIRWAEKKFNIKGGGFFIRFGETDRTGSSVEHLHAQLVVGNSKHGPNSEAIRVKLGYGKK